MKKRKLLNHGLTSSIPSMQKAGADGLLSLCCPRHVSARIQSVPRCQDMQARELGRAHSAKQHLSGKKEKRRRRWMMSTQHCPTTEIKGRQQTAQPGHTIALCASTF